VVEETNTTMAKNAPYLQTDLHGKTVVFSGGTDGMGKTAVEKLAKLGARIMLLGRSKEKTMAVVKEINEMAQHTDGDAVHYVPCDLACQKSIRTAASIILEKCSRIDLLINCAGMNSGIRKVTEDGLEMSWAVNHLAPFLLSNLLLDRLKESSSSMASSARIVNLSSASEKYGHIHFEDIQLEKSGWSTIKSYSQAKLAMNMCTRKMAKELLSSGSTHNVFVNALNPGFINSNLLRDLSGWEMIVGVPSCYFSAPRQRWEPTGFCEWPYPTNIPMSLGNLCTKMPFAIPTRKLWMMNLLRKFGRYQSRKLD